MCLILREKLSSKLKNEKHKHIVNIFTSQCFTLFQIYYYYYWV